MVGHRPVQSEVAHHGRDERVGHEVPAVLHRDREDRHDLVAVDDAPARVDREAAVGVSVVGDADIGTDPHDVRREGVEVGGADAVIDVQAVRVGSDHRDARAGVAERLG